MDALIRFVEAQKINWPKALAEVKTGRKTGHWMWYIFPQLRGLGFSQNSEFYGIKNLAEAKAYLSHPVLGKRLEQISEVLLQLPENNVTAILGRPDDLKLRSCMTLFAAAGTENDIYKNVLKKYFHSEPDLRTLELLKLKSLS